jgi:tetratricopeptide (TPR) repeat protein
MDAQNQIVETSSSVKQLPKNAKNIDTFSVSVLTSNVQVRARFCSHPYKFSSANPHGKAPEPAIAESRRPRKMSFDKIKAMRNAEKFLAQGKIKAAIGEYQQVVDHDSKDFGTMNLLGDLYSKSGETKSALRYYNKVAEHYSKQGFSQKAIAVYNKINKIQPNSVQVSEKLAELYKTKGSVTEAKSHYVVLAESYQAKGRMVEALAMWKQIALLDPTNTEVYLTIADSYLKEGQTEEAVDAFADAGDRFVSRGMFVDAESAYTSGLGCLATHQRCIDGLVNLFVGQGRVDAAIEKLEGILADNKNARELLGALSDCYLEAGDREKAEKAVIKLVEQEPAHYPKFLELAKKFVDHAENAAACRMLTMASEHMIAGGQAEEFVEVVRAVLEQEPDNLDAVRLLVRFCTWQKDEDALKESLRRLADLAQVNDSVDDERFALSQLVILVPQEARFADRLLEINTQYGFEDAAPNSMFDDRFFGSRGAVDTEEANAPEADFAIVGAVIESSNGETIPIEVNGFEMGPSFVEQEDAPAVPAEPIDNSPGARRQREAESIRFYIENGYTELAEKAIEEFEAEFGQTPESLELRGLLGGAGADTTPTAAVASDPEPATQNKLFDIDEFRNELGLEEAEAADSDFDTKYHTAIASKEMGLIEQAIAEFQDAAAIVKPTDGTRRFFNCANLLGHSFMENGMPKLAMQWYQRALEIPDLNPDEKQALWYELGLVHESENEYAEAGKYFEQVYAENVDYRDVRERLKNMAIAA